MQTSPIHIVHFHNGTGGGVLAVIQNLIRFSTNNMVVNHVIYTINKQQNPSFVKPSIPRANSEKIFYYSTANNFYHTCRQLAKLLPDDKAIIVAHDWLELGMVSNLGLQNPVVQIVHGNYAYYYQLAIGHSAVVDAYVCISKKIGITLNKKLPIRNNDIFCLHFPVPVIEADGKINVSLHLIYYVGNLKDSNKQFATIIAVANELSTDAANYFFTIAGGGMTTQEFFDLWPVSMKDRVDYKGQQTNEAIMASLPMQDIFLLPSLAEGLPVSLVEAMKAGAVPVVTGWNGGVDELISSGTTGYYCKPGAIAEYVACIKKMQGNRKLHKELSDNCIQKANALFDPVNNTKQFEEVYFKIATQKKKKRVAEKVYGSRLDHRLIPNCITYFLRRFSK